MHRSSWAKYIETVKIKAKGCESSYDFRFRSSFSGSSVTQTGRKSKFFARLCHLFSMISATLSQLASNRIFPRWHLVNLFDNRLTKSVWRSENLGQIFCSYKTLPSIACNNRLVFFQAWSTWLQTKRRRMLTPCGTSRSASSAWTFASVSLVIGWPVLAKFWKLWPVRLLSSPRPDTLSVHSVSGGTRRSPFTAQSEALRQKKSSSEAWR